MITVRLISVCTMFLLAGCRYEEAELNHLLTLDAKAIRTIHYPHSVTSCRLTLNNMTSLTLEDALIVASWNPNEPLWSITPEWSNWLYKSPDIIKEILFQLDVSISRACSLSLELNGITELSEASAKALSKFKGSEIQLNGLTELPAEIAEALVAKGQRMSFQLDSVQTLSVESAKALGGVSSGDLSLASVHTLDTESYIALGSYRESCRLGIREMTVQEAAIVGSWDFTHYIYFPNLENVSSDHARAFVNNFRGGYTFDVIDAVDVSAAAVFYPWVLYMPEGVRRDLILANSVTIHLSENAPLKQSKMCTHRYDIGGFYCE